MIFHLFIILPTHRGKITLPGLKIHIISCFHYRSLVKKLIYKLWTHVAGNITF